MLNFKAVLYDLRKSRNLKPKNINDRFLNRSNEHILYILYIHIHVIIIIYINMLFLFFASFFSFYRFRFGFSLVFVWFRFGYCLVLVRLLYYESAQTTVGVVAGTGTN